MKRKSICLRMRLHWLILLLLSDVFFVFLVRLANPDALASLGFVILLYTLLSVALGYAIDRIRINVRLSAAEDFLERQGEYEEQELLAVADKAWHKTYPGRQDATGMGLYFVKKYAEVLAVDVRVEEERILDGGFGIELLFPMI